MHRVMMHIITYTLSSTQTEKCTAVIDSPTLSSAFESFGNGTENETRSRTCFSTERTVSTEPTESNSCVTRRTEHNRRIHYTTPAHLNSSAMQEEPTSKHKYACTAQNTQVNTSIHQRLIHTHMYTLVEWSFPRRTRHYPVALLFLYILYPSVLDLYIL